jgi:transketolase
VRTAFADTLEQCAAADDRIVLLSGDIGNRMFDSFKQRFPQRFYNCGVAEANMMGVAAGLAACGLRPVVYTITPFVTTRCLEQIRVDVCYHHQPVIIVGVGGGLAYANLGATHHSCEDIGMLRTLPHMRVVCPCDRAEVKAALPAAVALGEPTYLRLGKKGEPDVHSAPPEFEIGRGIELRRGDDIVLLATGNITPSALRAADLLEQQNIGAAVYSVHTVKPLDEQLLAASFRRARLVVTLEEHSAIGGLGGGVAEWLADNPSASPLLRIGTPDSFFHQAGSPEYARRQWGLSPDAIAQRIQQHIDSQTS